MRREPIKRAMLMAAGLGTRLRPYTERCPKALIPLMGVPMAQFALDALVAAGVEEVVANVHHLPELARAGLEALERPGLRLIVSDEGEAILGSAGGIRRALPYFENEPFYLVNADVVSELDLRELGLRHLKMRERQGALLTLALRPGGAESYREIGLDAESGLIDSLGEVVPGKPYFTGAAVLEPQALASVPEGASEFLPMILKPAVEARRACGILTGGLWLDVGNEALWRRAHFELIALLETGRLAPRLRRRIEKVAKRVSNGVWLERGCLPGDLTQVVAPAFFGKFKRF